MRARERTPEITVIISTLGNYSGLARVLDGYARQTAPAGSFTVLVVSDAADPEPDSVDRAIGERPFPVQKLVPTERGLSANRNLGMKTAGTPLILFTDNDTIPVPRFISEHLRSHRRFTREEDAVLGRVRWSREIEITTFMKWLDTGFQFDFGNVKGIEAGWGRFARANVSLQRSFALRVGDFDSEHFPYGVYEDTDWAYRASLLGMHLVYNRRALIDHLRPMSVEYWANRASKVAESEYWFAQLHPELQPWFYAIFKDFLSAPPGGSRGVRLARFVPRRTPWLGPRVWKAVDYRFKREIAPKFMEGWEKAAASDTSSR